MTQKYLLNNFLGMVSDMFKKKNWISWHLKEIKLLTCFQIHFQIV